MGWSKIQRHAPDDEGITDSQQREITRLKEAIDRVPSGTYEDERYTMTRREASIYIDVLKVRLEKRRARRR